MRWVGGSIPFLGVLNSRKEDGKVKVQVYQKATHTDQYRNFSSHHPLNHTMCVIRTLYEQCDNIVTEEVDAAKEIDRVNRALGACSYLSWSVKRVKEHMKQGERKNNRKIDKKYSKDNSTKTRVILPYIRGVSEALSQVSFHHGVVMSMKLHRMNERMLVHSKDKHTP